MTAYFVIGSAFVVWALVLTAFGLMRRDFPPTREMGRAIVTFSGVLFVATVATLLLTTKREHPRIEAKAKAAEEQAKKPEGKNAAGGIVPVVEKEYSIKLELPRKGPLQAGPYGFEVANAGKVPHDLQVKGPGTLEKTPLIKPGGDAKLEAELAPGKVTLICTVPGHAQLGMKASLVVQ